MDAQSPESWRNERKCAVFGLSLRQVERIVRQHPAMFRVLFPPRIVNNLYFDTADLSCYHATVNGLGRRTKYRLRWYGPWNGGPVSGAQFEVKIKRSYANSKITSPLGEEPVPVHGGPATAEALTGGCRLSGSLREALAAMRPSLLNRYARRYYCSADGMFRLTIDTEIEYGGARADGAVRLMPLLSPRCIIVEVKYTVEDDVAAHAITAQFPFRVTRNSKYTNGIAALQRAGML